MGKISKKNGGHLIKEVQWSSIMDDVLVDTFLHQVIIGGKVNGTFTSKAYDDIVKELIENFHMEINKDKVKNRQKTSKNNFHECYDICGGIRPKKSLPTHPTKAHGQFE